MSSFCLDIWDIFAWRKNNYYVEINKKVYIILYVVDIDFCYN